MLKKLTSVLCAAALFLGAIPLCSAASQTTLTYEAENAALSGLSVGSGAGYSGGGYVVMESSGNCTFTIEIPETGLYDLNFVSEGLGGDKVNIAAMDGERIGEFSSKAGVLGDALISTVYIEKGTHKVRVMPSWGWINLDCLKVTRTEVKDYYSVSDKLTNPNASEQAKALMSLLTSSFGKYVLAGQQCDGMNSAEFKAITAATGKSPAVMGLDLMDYTPSRVERGANCKTVENAIEFNNAGGIVTICWHWGAPSRYIKDGKDSNGNPMWWGGFYTDHVNMDFAAVMNKTDKAGYDLLMSDIDAIAVQLAKLRDAGVPVLFRPLHEASGGWFWWGSGGADAYKKLWRTMYDKLTNEYGLNNLIWVYNGQDKAWYPGDEYVDIIGEDIYPGTHVYAPQSSKFIEAAEYTSAKKIVTLSENGCLFDVDAAINAGTLWSWFCVWGGEFAVSGGSLSEKYTEAAVWKSVYNHEKVVTLDELSALRSGKAPAAEKQSLSKATVQKIADKAWTGKAIKPDVTVTLGGRTLLKGTDYTLSYKNNTNVGTATVTIKGKGNYTGSIAKTFTIKPPKESITALSAKSGGFKVTFKKQPPASAYQIQYSVSRSFTGAKTTAVKGTAKTVTGLTSGKTYYVRARSYTVVNGKKIYGAWSAVKKVTVG